MSTKRLGNIWSDNREWILAVITLLSMGVGFVSFGIVGVAIAVGLLFIVAITALWLTYGRRDPSFVKLIDGNIGSFDWSKLFRDKLRVIVIARFCDSILERHNRDILRFLRNGGRLLLVLPDPRCRFTMDLAEKQRNHGASERALHPDALIDRILNSIRVAENLQARARAPSDAVRIELIRELPNYSLFYAEQRSVVLAPYEMTFDTEARAPALEVNLEHIADDQGLQQFIQHEVEELPKRCELSPGFASLRKTLGGNS